jgi:hypothetical protein
MDPISVLRKCDVVRIGLLIAAASDSEGQVPAKDYYAHGLCLPSTSGQLMLNFDIGALAQQLGYPIQSSFIVAMQGTVDGTDQNGDPVVKWGVDEPINRVIDDVYIESVHGVIRTSVSALDPTIRNSLCGQNRLYVVDLESDGTPDDTLVIKVHKTFLAVDYGDTITVSKIAMSAKAGLAFDLSTQITPRGENACEPVRRVEGAAIKLHALTGGSVATLVDSYKWQAPGAVILDGQFSPEATIQLPSPPAAVTVSVEVTAVGVSVVDHVTFTPLTKAEAGRMDALMSLICKIRHEVLINEFFNPLEDPRIDAALAGAKSEVQKRLGTSAARLAALAKRLSALTNSHE